MTLTDAVKKMRGKPGDPIHLTILRESEKKILEFTIIRDIIKIKDIKGVQILEDGIGYIRLVEFRENTARQMDIALNKLLDEGMNAFILDLRNNPGGLLDVAVKVSEKFIEPNKMVVYTKGRKEFQNMEFLSKSRSPLTDLPMVVLINGGSASGSEIVAGCLQDYRRALIVGMQSFGKGSVQTVIPLSDGSAIRMTTSKYFTPLGKEIHGKGVTPDIEVEESLGRTANEPENPEQEKIKEVFEKVEKKKNKKDDVKKKKEEDQADTEIRELKDYKSDNQLMRAIDVLKAVKIYNIGSSKNAASTEKDPEKKADEKI